MKRILICVLLLSLAGCAGSIGRKGIQASAGPATADATGNVTSKIDVDVATRALDMVGNLAVVVLRAGLPGALGAAVLPAPAPAPAPQAREDQPVAPHALRDHTGLDEE